jgi:threonyl-tRNA synthetase
MKINSQIEEKRHSLSHILAYAVKEIFPEAKFGIGPAIENGFYYDFELPRTLVPEDLKLITEKMNEIIKKDINFEKRESSIDEALKLKNDQPYKKELIGELSGQQKEVCFYKVGDFEDLCAGPHVESTGKVGPFKLMSVAGAYWRGKEDNPMLQRVYGVAFDTQQELDTYLYNLEEAKKRDHRKLGKELDLFVFSDLVGPGLPLYTPKGTVVRQKIHEFSRELRKSIGYQEVNTQVINKAELFKTSGHYEKYSEDMFKVVSHYTKEEYFLKPMNCPQHTQLYSSQIRSYRDLPYRVSDFSMLYRDERLGEICGLTRLRGFCQDDGHCFCREDQIGEEFNLLLGVIKKALDVYGMDFYIRLSLRDPDQKASYLGSDEVWEKSEKILEELLCKSGLPYILGIGDAAFYGPKMDIIAKDSLGREWQLSTIQIDFNMPSRFDLKYIGEDGQDHTPVMIHCAIVGSPDRFMGVLIEHYAGAFPLWLAPVQIKLMPIADRHIDFVKELANKLFENGLRVEIDDRKESVGKKIREAEVKKIPYMLIVGDKEVEEKKISVRKYGQVDLGACEVDEFIEKIILEDKNRQR